MTLIGQDLRAGQPGVVVYRVMQVSVTAVLVTVPVVFAPGHPEFSVATTFGNQAQFFDIHMYQLTRCGLLIADAGRCAPRDPRW